MSAATLISGRYRLVGEIGRGGMGVVWEGFDELLRRSVALKEVHFPNGLSAADQERLAGRTLREARAVAAVETPSAVRVFDIVEEDGRPWIVMELVRGRTLTALLGERGSLPPAEVAAMGLALLDALETAHAAGVLHRDVKPSNVLVGDDGRVALTDFGIATVDSDSDGDSGNTTSGVLVGSPAYVAPERVHGKRPTPASDLWSLGATLWTAAEGRPPFEGPTAYAVMSAVATSDPPPAVRAAGPLGALLSQVMHRDPAARPTPAQFRAALERVVADPQPTQALPLDPVRAPVPPSFDETTVLVAGAAATPTALRPPPDRPRPPARPARTPATRGPRSGRGAGLPVAAALLAVAAVAGLVLLLGRSPTSPTKLAAPAAPAAPASGSGSASPVARPSAAAASASAPAVAPGLRRFTDPSLGWSVEVPDGWAPAVTDSGTRFADPAGGRYILVATRYPAGPSAVGAWQDSERAFAGAHSGYRRLRLEPVTVAGSRDAADWEFLYSDGGSTLHALDHGMVFGSRGYAVYLQSHADTWNSSQQLFAQAENSFRPGRTGA